MAKLFRLFVYGGLVGILTSAIYCARIADGKRARVAVIKDVLCSQLYALSRIVNNEALAEVADKIKYEKF